MEHLTPVQILESLHENSTGARVHFCSKTRDKFNELASVPAEQIGVFFPQIEPFLETDAYFSLNSFSMPSRYICPQTGLPKPAGKKVNLQTLNGLFGDFDTGRTGTRHSDAQRQNTRDAMAQAMDKIEKLGIPHPTFWVESGRGFYMVWAFDESLKAWPETVARVENAQRTLAKIHPAFDPACVNANRVLRVPNTRHSATRKRALWIRDATGAERYAAEELWAKLGIDSERAQRYAVTQNPNSCPNRSAGRLALFRNIERELLALHSARGGFAEGTRRYALTVYAVAKMNQLQSPFSIAEAVAQMALRCQPAYPSHSNDRTPAQILRDARELKNEHRTAETMIKRLRITQAEADELKLKTLNPALIENRKAARKNRSESTGRPNRAARVQFVQQFLKNNATATVREVLSATQAAGIKTSIGTVQSDMAQAKPDARDA